MVKVVTDRFLEELKGKIEGIEDAYKVLEEIRDFILKDWKVDTQKLKDELRLVEEVIEWVRSRSG